MTPMIFQSCIFEIYIGDSMSMQSLNSLRPNRMKGKTIRLQKYRTQCQDGLLHWGLHGRKPLRMSRRLPTKTMSSINLT